MQEGAFADTPAHPQTPQQLFLIAPGRELPPLPRSLVAFLDRLFTSSIACWLPRSPVDCLDRLWTVSIGCWLPRSLASFTDRLFTSSIARFPFLVARFTSLNHQRYLFCNPGLNQAVLMKYVI